ncbi:MAG: pantoate--beta-alanine ligase [Saprospiraceae bacterium]|nr:pantoate--beta-alanine ligase [Saprospiraceae bacterium]MDW8229038.1 pantoate--beta-alanine ligase [Saprospiraceae bacterium]
MHIFEKIADLREWLARQRKSGRSIGFAPTMGALHEGHLSLVRAAKAAGDVSVVSIFVNPTQFNDPEDLRRYPRMPEHDIALLQRAGCQALFMPELEEIYPPGQDLTVLLDFGPLTEVMEGQFRPGHFQGMATVVKRLLDIVEPQRLYMGQKDFQQLTIVRRMLQLLAMPVELVMCPTVRELDGLAMSSRNLRLTPPMRAAAPALFRALTAAREDFVAGKPVADIREAALATLREAGLQPEYFEIVDGYTLLPVETQEAGPFVVACVAAWAGQVRLIDNLILTGEGDGAFQTPAG